jgi:hypothetical protein
MAAQNTTVASFAPIKKSISITIQSRDTMVLTMTDDDLWSGEYVRLGPDLQQAVLADSRTETGPSSLDLDGIYRAAGGEEIAFEEPHFTWINPAGLPRSGGFAILSSVPLLNGYYLERELPAKVDIIMFKYIEADSVTSQDASYLLEYAEKTENNAVIRTIALTPASLTVRGAFVTDRETQVLEQIEMVNNS